MINTYAGSGASRTSPNFRVLVKGKSGWKPIQIYKDEDGRNWVEARDGTHFALEFINTTNNKMLAVASVDGLNIITGDRAQKVNKGGYVITPYHTEKIEGWRTGDNTVREFVFTMKKNETYAAKATGDASNVGVLAVAYFKEVVYRERCCWTDYGLERSPSLGNFGYNGTSSNSLYSSSTITTNSVDNSPVMASMSFADNCSESNPRAMYKKSFSMGTEMGDEKRSETVKVSYEFEDAPCYDFVIYYDSRENLIANGIMKPEKKLPEPFENTGYCKVV